MITVPQSTVEKPLTVIDYIALIEQCHSITDVAQFSEQLPLSVRQDDRYNRAVAKRLAAIADKKAAA